MSANECLACTSTDVYMTVYYLFIVYPLCLDLLKYFNIAISFTMSFLEKLPGSSRSVTTASNNLYNSTGLLYANAEHPVQFSIWQNSLASQTVWPAKQFGSKVI